MAEHLPLTESQNVEIIGELLLDSPIFFLSKGPGQKMPRLLQAIREIQNQFEADGPTSIKAISHEYSDESYSILVVFEAKP